MIDVVGVVAAIIENEEKEILIAKRKQGKSMGGFWEFPGGKIEPSEEPEESLVRELKEEMDIEIEVGEYFGENIHQYERMKVRLIAFKCKIVNGHIELKDHDEYAWVKAEELGGFVFAEADIKFVERLMGM